MSHVSSIQKSTYPYRGSLSELDANGDGIISQQEIEIAQRPGLLASTASAGESSSNALSGVMAAIMKINDSTSSSGAGQTAPAHGDADMQIAVTAYRNTYGQYDTGSAAA